MTVRRLEAPGAWKWPSLAEAWASRELLFFFVWRDVTVRYKQMALGAAWAVIQPFMTMVVFSIFFGRFARMPSDGIPYPLFAMCGLVPWTYFSSALTSGTQSLAAQHHIISKVYFPRVLVPLASVAAPLVDFAVALAIVFALAAAYHVTPSAPVVFLPAFLALAVLTAAAVSLWLSALSARYRDVRYVIPFVIQIWMFASPVVYPASIVPQRWRPWFALNPMTGVLEGFRWALLGAPAPGVVMPLVSGVVVALVAAAGLAYFRHVEGTFADVL
jgi:lipopolysaccharide transport system permease protein